MEAAEPWRALYAGARGLLEVRAICGRRQVERCFVPVGSARAYARAMAFAGRYDGRAPVVAFGV